MSKFISKESAFEYDHRAVFANRVCKLIYNKCENDIAVAVKEIKPLYDNFEECVRNVYELVDTCIPLFAYFELLKNGRENYGMSENEYADALADANKACDEYYLPFGPKYVKIMGTEEVKATDPDSIGKVFKVEGYKAPHAHFSINGKRMHGRPPHVIEATEEEFNNQ